MITIYIILAIIAYIAIGGFVGGIFGDDDNIMWVIGFWPIFVGIVLVSLIAYLPYKLGEALVNEIRFLKRRRHG